MSSYYFLSVPLFISVHLSWTWRGGRKRRKPKLMNLSRWNFSRALTTTWLGLVTYRYHLFAGNYLWRIATFCRPTNISASLNLFSLCFPLGLQREKVQTDGSESCELCYFSITAQETFYIVSTCRGIQLSLPSPYRWHILLSISAAAVTCLQWRLVLPAGKIEEISWITLPDP